MKNKKALAIGVAAVLVVAFFYFGNKKGVASVVPPKTA
jgi:hypothetical protein